MLKTRKYIWHASHGLIIRHLHICMCTATRSHPAHTVNISPSDDRMQNVQHTFVHILHAQCTLHNFVFIASCTCTCTTHTHTYYVQQPHTGISFQNNGVSSVARGISSKYSDAPFFECSDFWFVQHMFDHR